MGFASIVEAERSHTQVDSSTDSDLESLLGELGRPFNIDHQQERVVRLTLSLQPTFKALPKTAEGRLDPAATRYLLHRYFVERHGWYVRGLETVGQSWNSSSPVGAIATHVSENVSQAFENRLRSRGLGLSEAALLAATLEDLVHKETLSRLNAAYSLSHVRKEGKVRDVDVARVMDKYMSMFLLGLNPAYWTRQGLSQQISTVRDVFWDYDQTLLWAHKVRAEALAASSLHPTSFAATVDTVEEIGDQYGPWQQQECLKLKSTLMKLEQPGTGRAPLADFYQAALDGNRQFRENRDYLRMLGALDESDPTEPSVIIANYVNGPSNCMASSVFYQVCCINECEAIQDHLEQQLAAPEVEPDRIAQVVAALPSATVQAPRQLSGELQQHLMDIAAQHDGRVPLHGRLFAQWLHHAYPLECPFPHLSGSLHPVVMEKWEEETGQESGSNETYMRHQVEMIRRGAASRAKGLRRVLPWLKQEELFIDQSVPLVTIMLAKVGQVALLVATVGVLYIAVRIVRSLVQVVAATAKRPRPDGLLSV